MRIKIELEFEYSDFRTIEVVSERLGLDPESTIRFLLRKGLEGLMSPSMTVPDKPKSVGKSTKKKEGGS